MNNLIEALQRYLCQVLNVRTKICPWKEKGALPLFLVNSYGFYEITLLKQPCLLMIAKKETAATPAAVKKHWEQVNKKWAGLCIYVQTTISAYNRQRLIQHRVPFIIPGNQMYLPDLGVDLRERFRQLIISRDFFSPATQAVVIYALCHEIDERFTPSELARKLDYSLMTLSRAFDELETAGIGEMLRQGRERWWLFKGSRRELWEQTKPLMRNPVKHRKWIRGKKSKIQAGLSALAHASMLSPPTIPVYAINLEEWKNCQQSGTEELPIPEEATAELEIWHYNPYLFSVEDIVDPFSLYLSLEKIEDERIESALEEMMKKIEW